MLLNQFRLRYVFKNYNICSKISVSACRLHVTSYLRNVETVDLAYTTYESSSETDGSKPPLVIFHGLLSSKSNWNRLSKALNETTGRKVICVDARNHGESRHSSQHTYIHMAHDVLQLLNKLKLSKISLLGHSMGGRTAMVLSLLCPSKVDNLVVVDISPISTAGFLNNYFLSLLDVMIAIDFKEQTNIDEAKDIAKNKLMASGLMKHEGDTKSILMNLGIRPDKSIGWMCNINTLRKYFDHVSSFPHEMTGRTFTGPTLFIGGGQSNYLPPDDISKIKELFPRAELKYVDDVGHHVHAENPTAFINLVKTFLSDK